MYNLCLHIICSLEVFTKSSVGMFIMKQGIRPRVLDAGEIMRVFIERTVNVNLNLPKRPPIVDSVGRMRQCVDIIGTIVFSKIVLKVCKDVQLRTNSNKNK